MKAVSEDSLVEMMSLCATTSSSVAGRYFSTHGSASNQACIGQLARRRRDDSRDEPDTIRSAKPSSPALPLPLSTLLVASDITASSTDMVGVGRGSKSDAKGCTRGRGGRRAA